MTIRDTQREIRKADKRKDLKDAGASAALGGAVGTAAMPMRPIRPRGKRQSEAKALWSQAEAAGGKAGSSADVDISPDKFVRLGQVKGKRLYNDAYTANSAQKAELPKSDPLHYDQTGKKYVTTAYKDKKGRVTLRQQDGRHTAETLSMRGKKIPSTVHMVEGNAPTEKNAVKAVYRHLASKYEGRKMATNLDLTKDSIAAKAKKYPKSAEKINDAAHERLGHKPGTAATDLPWKSGKAMSTKALRSKQAAYVGGGAVAVAGANALSEKASGKGVGTETLKAGKKGSDLTRTTVAAAIDPDKKVKIGKSGRKKVLKPIASALAAGTAGGVIANQLPQNQKDSRKLIKKADDRTERAAAGATGATAGVMAMPMRDKIGKPAKKFARKYKDIPEGTSRRAMPSKDLQTIAAPGVRSKNPFTEKKTNLNYTTKMAAAIDRGDMEKAKPRVVVYDDAARITGGQHRVHATGWAGNKTQDAEVVRVKGYYGGTERGHKAIRSRAKRAVYPKMFIKGAPKDTADLRYKDAKISEKSTAAARGKATETARVPYHKAFTKKDLRKLKGKQAAYIGGGAAAAVGAREAYRKYM